MCSLESQVKDNEQKFMNLNKKIHELEGNLTEKETLINKMQKKIARLNAVILTKRNSFLLLTL
jgi:peptidoglycan hydrolase CwlO-like protein